MRIFTKRHLAVAAVAGSLVAMSGATAFAASPAESLALRKAVMQSIGAHFGATVAAIDLARTVSPELKAADAETIFRAVFDGALAPLDRFSRYIR